MNKIKYYVTIKFDLIHRLTEKTAINFAQSLNTSKLPIKLKYKKQLLNGKSILFYIFLYTLIYSHCQLSTYKKKQIKNFTAYE